MKPLTITSFLLLFYCCTSNSSFDSSKHADAQSVRKKPEFELTIVADSLPRKGSMKMNVPISIFNTSSETLYLASSSCYGPCHYLEADTAQWGFFSLTNCVANWPVIEIISPNESLTFTSCIQNMIAVDSLNLGLRFMNTNEINMDKLSDSEIKEKSEVYWKVIKL